MSDNSPAPPDTSLPVPEMSGEATWEEEDLEKQDENNGSVNHGEQREGGRAGSGGGLDKLGREELVTKCRQLLALAQKAKAAKDESVAELKRVRAVAGRCEAAEGRVQQVEAQGEALGEMVANLTEGKVALTTKIESLQRQLRVASSEVESLQAAESQLLGDRNQVLSENAELHEERKKNITKLKELEASVRKTDLLERSWTQEKHNMEEKLENLQAQIGQIDVLKVKCKKLFNEKTSLEEEVQKQQNVAVKHTKLQSEVAALKEEKKATDIVFQSTKKEKQDLEERVQGLECEVSQMRKAKEEGDENMHANGEKVKDFEEKLKLQENSLHESERYISELQEKLHDMEQENIVHQGKEEEENEVERLRQELTTEKERNDQLMQQQKELEANSVSEMENLQSSLSKMKEQLHEKESELLTFREERSSIEHITEEVQELRAREELLQQQKSEAESKLEQQKSEAESKLEQQKSEAESKLEQQKSEAESKLELESGNSESLKTQIVALEEKLKVKEGSLEQVTGTLQDLKAEGELLMKQKTDAESKLELKTQNLEVVKNQIIALEENLKMQVNEDREAVIMTENEKINLAEKLEEAESENMRLTEHMKKIESECSDLQRLKELSEELNAKVSQLSTDAQQSSEEKSRLHEINEELKQTLSQVQKNLEVVEEEKANLKTDLFQAVSEVEKSVGGAKEEQDKATQLTLHMKEIETENEELKVKVKELIGEAEELKQTLNTMQGCGRHLIKECRETYPVLAQNVLPLVQGQEGNVTEQVEGFTKLMEAVKKRKEAAHYVDNVASLTRALDHFHQQSNSLLSVRDPATWEATSASLKEVMSCLLVLHRILTMVMDVEENNQLEEDSTQATCTFSKLCTHLGLETQTLDQVTADLEQLRQGRDEAELREAKAGEEHRALRTQYEELCKETEVMQENLKQINNLNETIAEYNESKKELNTSLENEKAKSQEHVGKISSLEAELQILKIQEVQLMSQIDEKEKIASDVIRQLNTEWDDSVEENVTLKESLARQEQDLKCLRQEKENLESTVKDHEREVNDLKAAVKELSEQSQQSQGNAASVKVDLEKQISRISEERLTLEKEFDALTVNKKLTEEKLLKEQKEFQEKLETLTQEQESRVRASESLKSENSVLQGKVEELGSKLESLQKEVGHLQEEIQKAEEKVQVVSSEKDCCEKTLKEAENQRQQLDASLKASTHRCEELLQELNQMNEALRERGERISRLEAAHQEKSGELEATAAHLKDLQNKMTSSEAELESKQEQLKTITEQLQSCGPVAAPQLPDTSAQQVTKLEEKIRELELERNNLKKAVKLLESDGSGGREGGCGGQDAQSEVLSTSTISRADDSQRMKELEDTFEERYMRLKSVAIKLKKRVAELTGQLKAVEEARNKAVGERQESGGKESMKAASKTIQALQSEIDRLQDEIDSKKKELKDQGKQLCAAAEQLSSVRSELAALQEENGILTRSVKNFEETISGQEDAAASLQGQVAALEKRLAAEVENKQMVDERRRKVEEKMVEEKQRSSQVVKQLEEAKHDAKTKVLLDMEMRDYELTVEELNGQLAERNTRITGLESEVERERGRCSSLQEQLAHLTTQEATERERAEKMKKLLLEQKTELAEVRQSLEKESCARRLDRSATEHLTQELEKQKLMLADISGEKTKYEDLLRHTKSTLGKQIEVLEEQVSRHKAEAQQLAAERDALHTEFEGYKVRAASVLRQKNRPPDVNVEDLQSEKDQLQSECAAAQLKLQQLQSDFSAMRAENSFLLSEKEGVSKQLISLTENFTSKEKSYRHKITNLESKMEAELKDYQTLTANLSAMNETQNMSFKKQFESVRQSHSREVEELNAKLEAAQENLWKQKNSVSGPAPPVAASLTPGAPPQPARPEVEHVAVAVAAPGGLTHRRQASHGCEESRIDVSNMVREEGEGSEWVEPVRRSPNKGGNYSPPPLEQLISAPLPPAGPLPQDDQMSVTSAATDATNRELTRLEAKIHAAEMRVTQLTSLLHESEAENAKLTQLSDALKEEIRRSARNEDREKHMENMEYMKNVILKFMLLGNGEERKHLVPVLKTVLQLSPQEASKLEHIATGEEGDAAGKGGWGNYLHLWSNR